MNIFGRKLLLSTYFVLNITLTYNRLYACIYINACFYFFFIRTVAERSDRGFAALQQRRGDRTGRFTVPHRENVGTTDSDAGQSDREQPGLASGRGRRSVQHAAADIGGQGTPFTAGSARGVDAAAAAGLVQRGGRGQPDSQRRRAVDRHAHLRRVPAFVLVLRPTEDRPGTGSVRYRTQGTPVRATGTPGAQDHGQADQGQCHSIT